MAYARFSSDDHQSTIYLYYSVGNVYALHVANHVTTLTDAEKEHLGPRVDVTQYNTPEEGLDALLHREERFRELFNAGGLRTEPFDHPLAGQTLYFDEPGDVIPVLNDLAAAGAHIPDVAFEAMREEQEDYIQ